MSRFQRVLLIAILLLAAGLRFYRLDGQSFWNDEGNSVRLAQRSLALVTAGAAGDIHPPGYYYLLWAWMQLAGDSEFAARSLSAALGVLLVAVTYALGRQLDCPALGLVAAFLAAISPFQVYYSQEARMYVLVTLLGAAATYVLVRWLQWESNRLESWKVGRLASWREGNLLARQLAGQPIFYFLMYALLSAAGLYTHYSYPVVVAAHNVVYGLWLLTTWRQGRVGGRLLRWLGVQLGALLLYAPWLPVAWPKLAGYGAISEAQPAGYIIGQAFRYYTLGPTAGNSVGEGWLLVLAVLALVGLAKQIADCRLQIADCRLQMANGKWQVAIRLLPLFYALAPVVMMVALSFSRPAYRPKFFLVGTPAFHLILASAILPIRLLNRLIQKPTNQLTNPPTNRLARPYTAVALFFVAFCALPGLRNYYYDPAYARDNYRSMADYIQAVARDGDAILLNAPNQWEVFTYYYGDRANVYPLPRSRPLNEADTAAELENIVVRHRRVFALYWGVAESDPNRFVESWLEAHTYRAADSWHGNVRLVVYAAPQAVGNEAQHLLDVTLGESIVLRGYSLAADAVQAGDVLQLTLFWQAEQRPAERYKVFVQLLDAANHVVGQLDSEPGGNLLPTDAWQPGQSIADRYGVLVQPGTPPGEHRLIVGMYSLSSGERLPAAQGEKSLGDYVALAHVTVSRPPAPPPAAALPRQNVAAWSHEGLSLLGYDLYRLGYAHQPEAPLHAGDALHINLYWQAQRPLTADWTLRLRLLDDSGQARAALDAPLAGVNYPTTQWASGEVVRAQFDFFVPGDAPVGRYRLEVTPLVPNGEGGPAWLSAPFAIQ